MFTWSKPIDSTKLEGSAELFIRFAGEGDDHVGAQRSVGHALHGCDR